LEFTGSGKISLTGLYLYDTKKIEEAPDGTSDASAPDDRKTQGAALHIAGTGVLDAVVISNSTLEVKAGTATTSSVSDSGGVDTTAAADATASGGGAYFGREGSQIADSLFEGNTVQATSGDATAGNATNTATKNDKATAIANASAIATASGGGAYFKGNGSEITNSLFQGNKALATGEGKTAKAGDAQITSADSEGHPTAVANASATAAGGGAYFGGNNSKIASSLFQGNIAQATGGTATGGGAGIGSNAGIRYLSTTAIVNAAGGGAYFANGGEIANSLFQGNKALATGGAATGAKALEENFFQYDKIVNAAAFATGGGVYFGRSGTLTNSIFQGNSVEATGGSLAQSEAPITWANVDAYALGGAVYLASTASQNGSQTLTIDGGAFIDNSVSAKAEGTVSQDGTERDPEAEAKGGAIFVSTSRPFRFLSGGTTTLALVTDAGGIVVSGNTADGKPDGIYFGQGIGNEGREGPKVTNGYFTESLAQTIFTVSATAHDIRLEDPVTVKLFGTSRGNQNVENQAIAQFTMTVKPGASQFYWGGTNVFDANAGAFVTFANGSRTVFLDNFTLGTTDIDSLEYRKGSGTDAYVIDTDFTFNPLTVTLETGAKLDISLRDPISNPGDPNDPGLALFDFTGSSSGSFNAASGAILGPLSLYARQLISIAHPPIWYLIAAGLSEADLEDAKKNLTLGPNIIGYFNEFDTDKLAAVVNGYLSPYETDDSKNTEDATPPLQDLLKDPAVSDDEFAAIVDHLDSVTPDHILNQAPASLELSRSLLDAAWSESFAEIEGKRGSRLWGRYLAGFSDRIDSHDRYRGYRADTDGFLIGFTRESDSGGAGAYFGHTRGKTKTSLTTGRIESEGYHLGLLGKIAPWKSLPQLILTGEAGVSRYTNEAKRHVGLGGIRADFDQRIVGLGLGAEVGLESGSAQLTPFARLRHAHLDQDGVNERGGLTRTRIDGFSGNSFTTELGARLSKTFVAPRGTATPYVSASWWHESGDTGFSASARYGLPDGHSLASLPEFRVGSVRRDRDRAILGTGIQTSFGLSQGRRLGINADYKAALGRNGVSHGFSVLLRLAF
jgi:hypothetical protein